MYRDIGEKIRQVAVFYFGLLTVVFVVLAVILFQSYLIGWGILSLLAGPIFALLSSYLIYGFGQLIDDVHTIKNQITGIKEEESITIPDSDRS